MRKIKQLSVLLLMVFLVGSLSSCGGETTNQRTYTQEEQRIYQMVIQGYNTLYNSVNDPASVKIYGIRLYYEDTVVFRFTATNGFGGTITYYAACSGGAILFDSQILYTGKEISWEDVVAYNNTL